MLLLTGRDPSTEGAGDTGNAGDAACMSGCALNRVNVSFAVNASVGVRVFTSVSTSGSDGGS